MVTRRGALRVGGTIIAGLAGCLGDTDRSDVSRRTPTDTPTGTGTETPGMTPDESRSPSPEPGIDPATLPGHVRPEGDPPAVPGELTCENDAFERRSGWIDEAGLGWGAVPGENGRVLFALRVDGLSFERGEEVTVTLTNVSGEELTTDNVHKSNFDVLTEAGWQDPRGWPDGQPKPVTDDLWSFGPGESHEWRFELTEEEVIEGGYPPHRDELTVCPELPAGRYRFATAAPESGDVAVAFDLTG